MYVFGKIIDRSIVVVVATLLDWEKGSSVACFRYKIGMYVLLDLFDFSVD